MDKKNSQLIKNTLLFGIGTFGSKIINFLFVPFYTSYLSTSEYGMADIINTSATLLVLILTINIMDGIVPYIIDKEYNNNSVLSVALTIIACATMFLIFALCIVRLVDVKGTENKYLVYLLIIFLVSSLHKLCSNYLQAENCALDISIAGISQTITVVVLNIILIAKLNKGIDGYLMSIMCGYFVALAYESIKLMQTIKWKFFFRAPQKALLKKMLVYSFPLMLNGVFWWLNTSIDKYFVIGICGSDQNGIYSVSTKIPTMLTTVVSVFIQAWSLSAIREYNKEDKDGFFYNTYEKFNSAVVVLSSIIIILIIPISKILFSKEFFVAWQPSAILVFSGVFSSLSSFVGSIFSAVKNSKAYFYSTVVAAVTNIILNSILIKCIGINGAAIATVASFLVVWGVRLKLASKFISWKLNLQKHIIEYSLIGLQVFAAVHRDHLYPLQIVIIFVMFLLNMKNIVNLTRELYTMVKNKSRNK